MSKAKYYFVPLLIATVFIFLGGFAYHQAYENTNQLSNIRGATRLLSNGFGNGSGVMIAPNRMLTAAHVAIVPGLVLNEKPVKVLKIDPIKDIALLEVEADCPCVNLGKPVKVDDEIITIGYPIYNMVKLQILTEGRAQGVMQMTEEDGGKIANYLVITSHVAPGNSGGGVYNKRGELVGILVGVATVNMIMFSQIIPHLAFAVNVNTIKDFLDKCS